MVSRSRRLLVFVGVWLVFSHIARRSSHCCSTEVPNQNENKNDAEDDAAAVCLISKAMKHHPLRVETYFQTAAVLPSPGMPHLSSVLCHKKSEPPPPPTEQQQQAAAAAAAEAVTVRSIICFKAARTGSTFFTKSFAKTMQQTALRPNTHLLWEPYCGLKCEDIPAHIQEVALATILTQRCTNYENRCEPHQNCRPFDRNAPPTETSRAMTQNMTTKEETGSDIPLSITALNPRFLHPRVDWKKALPETAKQATRIFALRRSNLVVHSYSKFHHRPNGKLFATALFGLDQLVRIAQHYALGDQELSSSIAWKAAQAAGASDPFLIVYEDVMANSSLVLQTVLQHAGIPKALAEANGSLLHRNAPKSKKHNQTLCSYDDVDCDELFRSLGSGKYPCLYKQLKEADRGYTWSVPLLPNGTVHIQGDCHRLPPITETHPVRHFSELYQLSNNNVGVH